MIHTLALLLLGAGGGDLQDKKPKAAPKGWDWEWRASAELAYDNNIWLLENGNQERLRNHERGPDPGFQSGDDEISGRYEDMEAEDDFILIPSLRWDGSAPSPLGRRFDLGVGLEIPVYFQNSRRTYLEFDLGIGQQVGTAGKLGLTVEFIPEYFRKNYFAESVNMFGNTSAAERRFEAGTYRQVDITLDYRHKLIDRTQQQPFGLTGTIDLMYRDRTYDSPFSYRDEKAPGIRLGLGFEYGPRVRWGIYYQYVAANSPSEQIVMLVNEILVGSDVNGLGGITDDARTIQSVDRTHKEHEIGLTVAVELSAKFEVQLAYERLTRDFESDETYDFEHRGREDTRDGFEANLAYKIAKAWEARLGYLWRQQESDLDDPEAGDDGDYDRDVFFASLIYRW